MKKYILSLCVMMSISIITVAQDTRVIASPMTLITNRIADNGNIGIGTILPSSPLHIRSSINRSLRLDLTGVLATSSYTWQSFFTNSIEQWRVVGRNADNANLEFWNKAGQSTFSLLQNGNVGIGTTTPNKKLEIKGGDGVGIRLFNENANTWDILNSTNGKLDFVRGGTGNFMTIDQIGRVGIGTTNPSSKLDVVGGHISLNDDTAGLPFKLWANGGSGSSTPNHMRLGTDSGHFGDAAMEIYQDYAGGAEQNPGRVVVNGTLSIGIGNNTVVPKQKLEVNGTVKMGGHYENLVSYAGGVTPANGYKIKTNIPFVSAVGMYNIDIHGYHYGNDSPIGLNLVFYVYGTPENFVGPKISSSGDWTPDVKLGVENGKIVIIIPEPGYYVRFGVSAFAPWSSAQDDDYFNGWTVADEAIGNATDVKDVSYENSFGNIAIKQNHGISAKEVNGQERRIIFNNSASGENLYMGHIDAGWGGGLLFNSGQYINFAVNNKDGVLNAMKINTDGNVGIGTTNPGAYKLAVNGNIHTKEVKVDLVGWSDFVFEKDYRLPTLKEVAQHIQEKGHLKDIPSAKEVAKNGIFLGEMNAKLLQKIEELTLYTLAQEEKINAANAKIAHLESEKEDFKKLSKLVAALQTKMDTIIPVKK